MYLSLIPYPFDYPRNLIYAAFEREMWLHIQFSVDNADVISAQKVLSADFLQKSD